VRAAGSALAGGFPRLAALGGRCDRGRGIEVAL